MAEAKPQGVYYRTEDYAGVGRRLLIDFIDFPVVLLLSFAALDAAARVESGGLALLLLMAIWFGYFVLLKRSRFGTLGYRIMGARIVSLRGERPGIASLVARLIFVIGGPLNFVFDALWVPGDRNRQALRDKFAGTYVIRKQASPAGTGAIAHRVYMFSGMTFIFREVKREAERAG